MIDNVDVTVLYRTNSHLDPRQPAVQCAELIVRRISGEIRPVQAPEVGGKTDDMHGRPVTATHTDADADADADVEETIRANEAALG